MQPSDIIDIPANEYLLSAKSMILEKANFLRGRQVVPFLIQLDQEEYSYLKGDKDYFDEEMQKEVTRANSNFKVLGGTGLTLSGCGGGFLAANSKYPQGHGGLVASGMFLSMAGVALMGASLLVKFITYPREAAKEIAMHRIIRLEAKERAIEKRLAELEDNSDNADEIEQLTQAKKHCELVRTVWDREHTPKGNSYISIR